MTAVHVVLPSGVDDVRRPSGGNTYDRRICAGLAEVGWQVEVHAIAGCWPTADSTAHEALAEVVASLPDGSVVMLDGLIASTAPEVLVPQADRVRQVVIVHLPAGAPRGSAPATRGAGARERRVLSGAVAVVTPSDWARRWLVERYGLPRGRIHVAEPGVDPAPSAPGTVDGGALLCVGAVARHKGHDLLLSALASLADLGWSCGVAGSLEVDPAFADHLRREAAGAGLGERVVFAGPLAGRALEGAYAAADLVVLASRTETYGMVVTEALSRGLPVVAPALGGIPEAMGSLDDGTRPGLLVRPHDPAALAAALRSWLEEPVLRQRLRGAAHERRETLPSWSQTTATVSRVLVKASR